jgi:hypothetical protein
MRQAREKRGSTHARKRELIEGRPRSGTLGGVVLLFLAVRLESQRDHGEDEVRRGSGDGRSLGVHGVTLRANNA